MVIEKYNKNISIVRDDLFPFLGGGNKARKIIEISKDIVKKKRNAVVTTGGIQSNHCRVTALICAKNNWKCKLILHGNKEDFLEQKGNALIMRWCGVDIEFVDSSEIGSAMQKAMICFEKEGFIPYYLKGGGHNKAGVEAYIASIETLKSKIGSQNQPEYIFLASGTGSTQAGILLGLEKVGWSETKVYGISVSRRKKRGVNGIVEAINFVVNDFDNSKILFCDDYLFGGYGIFNNELEDFCYTVAKDKGILLDTYYTGKAFYGMQDIIRKNKITGSVLFWHTGGLLNIMA